MNIGFIGAGKLGLPVALSIDSKGHDVVVTDINRAPLEYLIKREIPYKEEGAQELLDNHSVRYTVDTKAVLVSSEIIFMPVQTPHGKEYEGVTVLPEDRKDFDYRFLKQAVEELSMAADQLGKERILVIISTVLPGTIEREIKPILSKYLKLCYNPFFIAMGTTIQDFENPEFVLLGCDEGPDSETVKKVIEFYSTIHKKLVYITSVKNAELIKVSYNTYISMKIAFANTLMEICHKIGADVDEVTEALCLSDKRLMSGKYLTGGMGDGGGCHPRDNIAMSWLAKKLMLSHNFFDDIMYARQSQTFWLANVANEYAIRKQLPIVILGLAFKEQTNITTGSPAVLLYNILKDCETGVSAQDPYTEILPDVNYWPDNCQEPAVFIIATRHKNFLDYKFPAGSVVIDPWRMFYISPNNIEYVPIGGGKS